MAVRQKFWEEVPVDRIFRSYPGETRERLTEAGNNFLLQHNQFPPKDDDVRADSVGGLRMVETMDDSNRPIREFSLAPGATKRSAWMGQFMAQPHLQLRICKTPQTPQQNARFEESLRATAEALANGTLQLPEIG